MTRKKIRTEKRKEGYTRIIKRERNARNERDKREQGKREVRMKELARKEGR